MDVGKVGSSLSGLIPEKLPSNDDDGQQESSSLMSMLVFREPDNSVLQSSFSSDEISSVSGFSWAWKSLNTKMDDESFEFVTLAAFDNISPFELLPIDSFEFYLHIENVRVVKMSFTKLGLKDGYNENFSFGFKMTFIDEMIDPTKVQDAIELASKNVNDGDFSFGVAGPMKLTKADWLSSVSPEMALKVRLSDVKSLVQSSINSQAKLGGGLGSILQLLGLENSKINMQVLGDRIRTITNLNLKTWANIKPPIDLTFPYETTVSIYAGDNQKVMTSIVKPITATRSPVGMMINTECDVIPENNEAAATAFAAAINPILSSPPQVIHFLILAI